MAKTSAVERNKKVIKLVASKAARRAKLKAIAQDKSLTIGERFAATVKLAQEPRNSSKTRIKNRCEVSGRPRAYYRKLKMSRIALRELASQGQIPGMVKSSW